MTFWALHLLHCPYLVLTESSNVGVRGICITVAPMSFSTSFLNSCHCSFHFTVGSLHNCQNYLLKKKKSIWSCQFALRLLFTPFFLQNTFQSPWYATQGPWWLAWPISQSVIFHTYISDYSSDRCQRDAENINISKLNWIHFDFLSFWLFSQSMDTSKSITIMRWRCIFIFVRKGSLIL